MPRKTASKASCFANEEADPLSDLLGEPATSSADLRAMPKRDRFVEATRARGRPRLAEWCKDGYTRCRLCPWTRPCVDPEKAKHLLGGHFKIHHKGQSACGHQPQYCKLPSIVTDLQDGPAWWRCPLCPLDIKYDDRAKTSASRIRRDQLQPKRSSHPRITWTMWRGVLSEQRVAKMRLTKYNARSSFNLQCKPPLVARFEPFRWPRLTDKTDGNTVVKFVKAWVCLK